MLLINVKFVKLSLPLPHVTLVAVCFKTVVLLLLIHCLLFLNLYVGFCVMLLFCYAVLYAISNFANISLGEIALVAFLKSSSRCRVAVGGSVSFPRGVVGWSAMCDCGISWSYLPTFWYIGSICQQD